MFDAATLTKVKDVAPRVQALELQGGHDLAGDNPDGLVKSVGQFLAGAGL